MAEAQHILVLGLGASGHAAAELALQSGAQVTVLDESAAPGLRDRVSGLEGRGVEVILDWQEESWPSWTPDLAVISPGIPPDSGLGSLAARLPCPVISELEFGFRHAPCPILAVTGTNGKTTTVELVNHCLRQADYRTEAAGNIGPPLSEAVRRHRTLDFLVVEVSSYQLERIDRFSPLAAALLNLSPDHLDRYAGEHEYYAAKMAMFRNMKRCDKIVLRKGLPAHPQVQEALPANGSRPLVFAAENDREADFLVDAEGYLCETDANGVERIAHRDEMRLKGRHNLENMLACFAIFRAAGIDPQEAVNGAKTFPPKAHRLELVHVRDGIRYINDSKSTNPDSLINALEAAAAETSGKIVLLAGGLDKGLDFAPVTPLLEKYVKEACLIGKSRRKLAALWGGAVSCKMFASLEAAVDSALDTANSGDTVLLSPGCASQDMFRDYAERGDRFSELIRRSLGE